MAKTIAKTRCSTPVLFLLSLRQISLGELHLINILVIEIGSFFTKHNYKNILMKRHSHPILHSSGRGA
ncbi:MAG: hypothetical protein ABIN04_05420 [Ginsengibacter sp.]